MLVRKYNNFVQERRINGLIKESLAIDLSDDSKDIFNQVFESLVNKIEDVSIKNEIESYVVSSSINENFFDKLKERFPKAAQVSNLLSDKAEQTLGAIISKAKDITGFIADISGKLKSFFVSSLEDLKAEFIEQFKNGKLKEKIASLTDTEKEGLKKDIVTGRGVIKWYRTEFLGKLLDSFKKNGVEFFQAEQTPVSEGMVNEGGNVIATLVHKIEEFPPFSWLAKVQQAGEASSNKLIELLSTVTSKMGGPGFELPVIAVLLGVVLEQTVKNFVGHGLLDIFGAATPLGLAIKGLKMVAMFIAFIVALDAVLGQAILGKHGDHGHGDDHGDDAHTKAPTHNEPASPEGKGQEMENPENKTPETTEGI